LFYHFLSLNQIDMMGRVALILSLTKSLTTMPVIFLDPFLFSTIGDIIEEIQGNVSRESSRLIEDYSSNYYGYIFRSFYRGWIGNPTSEFSNFFNDLTSGKISYKRSHSNLPDSYLSIADFGYIANAF
jgi:hypothetical protein